MKHVFIYGTLLITQLVSGQKKQNSASDAAPAKQTEAAIDSVFNQAYPAYSPGACVLIARDNEVIYRKAFGMANLELNVPMKSENVFQLASITKQFTSVAILLLMEKGQLSLHNPLSKYIADFPRGNEITLHHLLNHTSGIKSFNTLPDFPDKIRLDVTPEEMIDRFKNLPLEFNPNEKHAYSNSGYFLLGYIIEKVSGLSYEDFIQKNIFDQLGMKNSYYLNTYKIIPDRASGYQLYEGHYENADYMSTTIPYAAGSLMSTVDDMFLWHKAIHNNTLISENSKLLAFANHTLNNGNPTNYGYGWFINEIARIKTLEHPGGTNGFTSSGIYVPDSSIYAIVLSNSDDGKGPEMPALKAVSILVGKPLVNKPAVALSETQLKKWVGAYQFKDVVRFITYENGFLYSTREGGRSIKLEPLSMNEFKFENSLTTYKFSSNKGKKQVLYTDRIIKTIGLETDKKLHRN